MRDDDDDDALEPDEVLVPLGEILDDNARKQEDQRAARWRRIQQLIDDGDADTAAARNRR